MPTVTYDDRSYMIDSSRIWLVSGSIHYFRVPAELWRDRLLKARRAGLNCIATYVAWNFHEPQEGQWDFTGDRDIVEFIRQAGEAGLYVILRPGPYICGEWDFGGLPGWLTTKTGIVYRTSNAAYTHYCDKFIGQALPRLADLQVTRGGNIVLIQNENEYFMKTMPERLNYLEFITQLFRRSGFDIPIITCNALTEPPVPETVECVNTWGQAVGQLKRLRLRQPGAPLLVTEFWAGWFDQWGEEHRQRGGARETARRGLEILGCGGQYNYYMWHGGTNFAFWGSRLCRTDSSYQTTSYDYDATLAEGGGLTDKYYLTRLVNMTAGRMGRFFAASKADTPGVNTDDAPDTLNVSGPLGRLAVITNNGRDEIDSAMVSLPDGKRLKVSLEPFGATLVPVGLKLSEERTLDYANLMPLGEFGENILVLHGPAGWDGRVSVNGRLLRAEVPKGDEVAVHEFEGLKVVLINTDLATRTWFVDDVLVFGPAFVGETTEDVVCGRGLKQYVLMEADGTVTRRKVKSSPPARRTPPRLGAWKRVLVCREPVADNLQWRKIDRPRDVDHLGAHYGYLWYRVETTEPRAVRRRLFLPDCEDRATVFLNGQLLGVWGRGEGAVRTPIGASFKRGTNVLTFLADNLGRLNFGPRIGELKGLYGHVYDSRELRAKQWKVRQEDTFPKRIIPRHLAYMIERLEAMPLHVAQVGITLSKVTPVHMSFTNVPHHAAVLCNERTVGFFPSTGINFGDATLSSELKKGRNTIKLLLWGDVDLKVTSNVRFHVLTEPISQEGAWSVRPWQPPEAEGPTVGKDLPAWYVSRFRHKESDEPLFLHVVGARKGQIFLNRHNVGRFWNIGPQQDYYLPDCWLAEDNELLIFEEGGSIPSRSRLAWRPLGPYRE